jgi:RNA polymerase sigma factor (sigma-70 family)
VQKLNQALSPEEQAIQFERLLQGDIEARDTLILTNQRLVAKVAAQYRGRGVEFEDLVSEGTLGLIEAIDKFNPHEGHKFSTYAIPWIRSYIQRALKPYGPTPPSSVPSDKVYEMFSSLDSVAPLLDRLPERQAMIINDYFLEGKQLREIAEQLDVSVQRVSQLRKQALELLVTIAQEEGLYV